MVRPPLYGRTVRHRHLARLLGRRSSLPQTRETTAHEVVPSRCQTPTKTARRWICSSLERKRFEELSDEERAELDRVRAREIGDALGLGSVGDYFENWGGSGEKWLRGDKDHWYFVTPDGELYRWSGRNNLMGWASRSFRRNILGQRSAEGELVATLGRPATDEQPNEFHADPQKMMARLFKSITTGPDLLRELAVEDGPLWPRGVAAEFAAEEARAKALERLTGTLFGPDGHQTCIILTLSEPGKRDLKRVIGRPLLGRPQGRLLELASVECGISPEELKLGGPPVDNVAIDEEGTITLARLVSYSALVGIVLSLLCFRSLKITMMIFFVGGLSAITSLGIVWWAGGTVDAIVMSMPSLVYVLGLSGAVHIVNYYRDAVEEHGVEGAAGRALAHGWKPCTLAAFTTALGLLSLNTSNILPIRNFGFYSAVGVMATLILLFTFLPSALQLWPPRFRIHRHDDGRVRRGGFHKHLLNFWIEVGPIHRPAARLGSSRLFAGLCRRGDGTAQTEYQRPSDQVVRRRCQDHPRLRLVGRASGTTGADGVGGPGSAPLDAVPRPRTGGRGGWSRQRLTSVFG
jgi:hypothetical protein